MKWPSLHESVSLCICLLTVACNPEMQPLFFGLFVGGGIWGSGRVWAVNLTVQVRSDDLGYGL